MAVSAAAMLVWTAVATATNLGSVRYTPPTISLIDQPESGSDEDVVLTKDGPEYSFAQPVGLVKHQKSEPGCTDGFSTDYRCPTAGIRKILLRLGAMDDEASIDLGGKARVVRQVLKGGDGDDVLAGGPGPQRLHGNQDDDTITGGPGPDVIKGGPGDDTCDGGPGRDKISGCES